MVKITVHAMERSLPTSVHYRSDRITSFSLEVDLGPVTDKPFLDPKWLSDLRERQLADLDAQEDVLRGRFFMHEPRAPEEATDADLRRPGGDFHTADKVQPPA